MIEEFNKFLHAALPYSGLITFALGLFFGNKYAIGRDRRKEFNAATDGVRYKLREQLKSIAQGRFPADKICITAAEKSSIVDVLTKKRSISFDAAWERYSMAQESCGERDEWGKFTFHDSAPLKKEITHLLSFINRK